MGQNEAQPSSQDQISCMVGKRRSLRISKIKKGQHLGNCVSALSCTDCIIHLCCVFKLLPPTIAQLWNKLRDDAARAAFCLPRCIRSLWYYTRSLWYYNRSLLNYTRSLSNCTRTPLYCTRSLLNYTRSLLNCTRSLWYCSRSLLIDTDDARESSVLSPSLFPSLTSSP